MRHIGPYARLIADLERERERLGMDNCRFAAYLGVNEGQWSVVRRGLQRPSHRMLAKIAARFPAFRDDAIALADAA